MDIRNDLIPLHAKPLAAVFDNADAMAKVLAQIEEGALAETADHTTADGRSSIKSLAYKVSRSKTALDGVGKALADTARVKYDEINAIRKTATDRLDALRDKIRKPVNDWEEVEKQRVEALEARLTAITAMGSLDSHTESSIIEGAISVLQGDSIDQHWQEFEERAAEAKAESLKHLIQVLAEAKEAEAKEAELETLRAEKLEREADDLEREREAAIAEREKVAAENARKKTEAAAEAALEREKGRAEREVADAERRAAEADLRAERAATAERERAEAEQATEVAARTKREADVAHRERILGAVATALIPFVAIDVADQIAEAIEAGKVPHVTINF